MDARPGPAVSQPIYNDIVPPHDLTQGDRADTLIIDVTGFKKEQIKVQIDKFGKLMVSGERPLGENKWVRFRKDFQTPENCNVSELRAKFEKGRVYITFPKLVVDPVPPPQDQPTQATAQDKKATEPKLPSTNQNGHSKIDGEQTEEKRSDPPLTDAKNKVEDKEADKSDEYSKSSSDTSDSSSEAESTGRPADQRKLSMRLLSFKQKALESVYGSRKEICSAFAVLVISVGVGMIISNKLIEFFSGASRESTDLVPII